MKEMEDKEFEELQAQYRLLTEKLSTQNIVSEQVISETTREHIDELKKVARRGWYFPLISITMPLWLLPMVVLVAVPLSIAIVDIGFHHQWPDYREYFSEVLRGCTDWSWIEEIPGKEALFLIFVMVVIAARDSILALWQSTLIGRLVRMQSDGSTPAEIGRYARDVYQQFHSSRLVYWQSGFSIVNSVILLVFIYLIHHKMTGITYFFLIFIVFEIIMIPVLLKRMKKPGMLDVFGILAPRNKKYFLKSMDYHLLQIMEEMEKIEE